MSVHLKNDFSVEMKGWNSENTFTGGNFPVVVIERKAAEHCVPEDIAIYATVEQLLELRQAISNAIRDHRNAENNKK